MPFARESGPGYFFAFRRYPLPGYRAQLFLDMGFAFIGCGGRGAAFGGAKGSGPRRRGPLGRRHAACSAPLPITAQLLFPHKKAPFG